MKGQRQLHLLWAWRERLDAEMPIKEVAVDLLSSVSFRPSFSFPFGFKESPSPSGIPDTHTPVYPGEQFFMSFVPFMSFLFRLLESH